MHVVFLFFTVGTGGTLTSQFQPPCLFVIRATTHTSKDNQLTYSIVVAMEVGELFELLLLLELIDKVFTTGDTLISGVSNSGVFTTGDTLISGVSNSGVLTTGDTLITGVSNSRVSKKGSPGGEGRRERGCNTTGGSLRGNKTCITLL